MFHYVCGEPRFLGLTSGGALNKLVRLTLHGSRKFPGPDGLRIS